MRVFRQQYTDRQGRTRESAKWYVEFVDHSEIRRRLPGFTDRKPTEELGRKVLRLVEARSIHQPTDPELTRWVETMPATLRQRLAKWGILDSRAEHHGRPLKEHLADFHAALLHKGNTAAHADLVKARAQRVCDGCRFKFYSDVSASKVQRHLADLRQGSADDAGISHQTSNFYLQALKQFCRWMVKDGRASESPVDHLSGLNVKLDRRHDRRSLTVEELTTLLKTTAAGPVRHKLDGRSRAMLYRVAMETGLRRNELRSITPACLELEADSPAIVLAPRDTKNRQPVVQCIRPELAAELRTWIEAAQIAPESPLWANMTPGHCPVASEGSGGRTGLLDRRYEVGRRT